MARKNRDGSIFKAAAFWIACLFLANLSSCVSYTSAKSPEASAYYSLDRGPAKAALPEAAGDLTVVGFTAREREPSDADVEAMVDDVVAQVLGPRGFASIIAKGDRVVLKVNNVGPYIGAPGSKGRAVITDPRIVRRVAESIRPIIGFDAPADLIVADSLFYTDKDPSRKDAKTSFYRAMLDRGGDSVFYDQDGDGILDGSSGARLVNLDGFSSDERYRSQVRARDGSYIDIWFPKLLRTKAQAIAQDKTDMPSQYCDILIGLPVLKSHGIAGITGALKLQYGFRPMMPAKSETGRFSHSGVTWAGGKMQGQQNLLDYLTAEHIVRDFDFSILDCLTGNRRGPLNPAGGITTTVDDDAVDYILVNAMAASRDSVACDTLEALLAGYEIESIGLLGTAYRSRLGTDRPVDILIGGQEAFGRHRAWLERSYGERYPFADGWGGAKTLEPARMSGLYAPGVRLRAEAPRAAPDGSREVAFELTGLIPGTTVPVRADLYRDGGLVAFSAFPPSLVHGAERVDGSIRWRPEASFAEGTLTLAVWDDVGNCLSTELPATSGL